MKGINDNLYSHPDFMLRVYARVKGSQLETLEAISDLMDFEDTTNEKIIMATQLTVDMFGANGDEVAKHARGWFTRSLSLNVDAIYKKTRPLLNRLMQYASLPDDQKEKIISAAKNGDSKDKMALMLATLIPSASLIAREVLMVLAAIDIETKQKVNINSGDTS